MVVAEQTTVSTLGIWVIIVVALVFLAIWLVGISVADNIQIRESHRWRQQRDAELAAGAATVLGSVEPAPVEAPAVPDQRRSGDQETPRPTLPTLDGAGDFRHDSAEASWRTQTPS
jgi:hypothetical protein